jgi:hypothetical protein
MQIDRPSRESRGASVLETARACSGGGFSGNHRCCFDEQSSSCIGVGSCRLWPPRLRLLGRTCFRRCAPTRRRQRVSVVFATCRGRGPPQGAASRTTRIVFRGLAPLAGKGRASARTTTGDGCSTSVERPEPLGSGLSLVACHRRLSRAKARDCPGFGTTWQGVSRAGRVRDCVVRPRVLIVKTDSRGAHRGAPSSKLRQ